MSEPYSPARRYIFAKHGRSDRFRHWEQRQQRRQGRQSVYQPAPGQQPDFTRIIDHENLLVVYDKLRAEGGAAPGIDNLTYSDFSRAEIAAALRVVSQAIVEHRYRPYPTRPVLTPKPNGRFRELLGDHRGPRGRQGGPGGHHAPAGPRPDAGRVRLPSRRSAWDMLLAIEKTAIEQDRWVLAVDDVRDAFPSVRLADAVADYSRHISNNGVLWLIETVLRGNEGQARTVGIDQGTAVGPGTLNLRLHYALDLPQSVDSITTDAAGPGNPPWYRWADNLTYLCQSVSEGNQALQRARALLQPAGFALKGEDGWPVNLKRQGASAQVLGFQVSYLDGRLRHGLGKKAWKNLEQRLEEAHAADNPGKAAMAAVRGLASSAWACLRGRGGTQRAGKGT